jgi:hypothetical protein
VALAAERLPVVLVGRTARTTDVAAVRTGEPVIDGEVVRGYGAFAFRKDDVALRAAFDEALETYLGSDEHLDLVEPFGFGTHTLPGDVTAADLCAAD